METLIIHAKKHERSYKEIEHDFWYFYASILQYIHCRTQYYVHSASHGLVSKLRVGKLSFSDLLEDIEDGDYAPLHLESETKITNRAQGTRQGVGRERGGCRIKKNSKKLSTMIKYLRTWNAHPTWHTGKYFIQQTDAELQRCPTQTAPSVATTGSIADGARKIVHWKQVMRRPYPMQNAGNARNISRSSSRSRNAGPGIAGTAQTQIKVSFSHQKTPN